MSHQIDLQFEKISTGYLSIWNSVQVICNCIDDQLNVTNSRAIKQNYSINIKLNTIFDTDFNMNIDFKQETRWSHRIKGKMYYGCLYVMIFWGLIIDDPADWLIKNEMKRCMIFLCDDRFYFILVVEPKVWSMIKLYWKRKI